ncbi:hypothetical protein HYC85_006940 [Camellia sinensis]|uniref:Uncharacterized protein n=1 Tax=Camellia sinensis TaxID=4442 RepID=A0A7J7HPZ9_CAMSI|nr:hypothetical protein HYC85_006940 [Camellia sinensis]
MQSEVREGSTARVRVKDARAGEALRTYTCRSRGFMSNIVTFRRIEEDVENMGFNPCKLNFVLAIHVLKSINSCGFWETPRVYDSVREQDHESDGFFLSIKLVGSLARKPILVSLSLEKRIVSRWAFYEVLLSKGLIKNNNNSLINMLVSLEKYFLKKFVNCHKEKAPKLLKLYKEKLAHAKQL